MERLRAERNGVSITVPESRTSNGLGNTVGLSDEIRGRASSGCLHKACGTAASSMTGAQFRVLHVTVLAPGCSHEILSRVRAICRCHRALNKTGGNHRRG